jgi:quercetin dioxygenase-like cupin family protein
MEKCMKINRLENMTRGWFIGNFEPTVFKTTNCEVAIKKYKNGSYEEKHFHKVATEITVITKGKVKMFGEIFNEGTIIEVEPGDITDFMAIEDAETVVIKIPGINNDKYLVKE